eukprot:COSAG03_NODE_8038_length_843_cov_1.552419_1_plen_46_part_10
MHSILTGLTLRHTTSRYRTSPLKGSPGAPTHFTIHAFFHIEDLGHS